MIPSASSLAFISLAFPSLKKRSLPDTLKPVPCKYWAMALIPAPAMPTKKGCLIFLRSDIIVGKFK